ncbi:nucleoside hydrolase [Gordonia sp. NPDC003950]
MIEFARSEPSGVLLCIGPLTNLATALTRTAAVQQLRRLQIVVSGGVGVSRSPMDARIRDTNTRHDPQATASVIRSDLSIRWVGLDVSRRFILRRTDMTAGQIGGSRRRAPMVCVDARWGGAPDGRPRATIWWPRRRRSIPQPSPGPPRPCGSRPVDRAPRCAEPPDTHGHGLIRTGPRPLWTSISTR